jgi:hypothetical protein
VVTVTEFFILSRYLAAKFVKRAGIKVIGESLPIFASVRTRTAFNTKGVSPTKVCAPGLVV